MAISLKKPAVDTRNLFGLAWFALKRVLFAIENRIGVRSLSNPQSKSTEQELLILLPGFAQGKIETTMMKGGCRIASDEPYLAWRGDNSEANDCTELLRWLQQSNFRNGSPVVV